MIGETIAKCIIKNDLENRYVGFKDKHGDIYWIERIEINEDGDIIFMESREVNEQRI